MELSERRACKTLIQPRTTQRYKPIQKDKDKALLAAMKRISREHPSYGYRFITAKLHQEGWYVNHKRSTATMAKGRLASSLQGQNKENSGLFTEQLFCEKGGVYQSRLDV